MFREMEYVYAVYKERNFTRAAKKMFISQPALSAMVKKAEKKIGAPIFDRSNSPLSLTPAGEYYIEQVEKILKIQEETKEHFRQFSLNRTTELRLCGAAIYQAYVFPTIVAEFMSRYPEIKVTWSEARTDLVQKLLTNQIDMFPEVNNFLSKQVDGVAWKDEELVLVVPSGDPINEGREDYRFTPEEIRAGLHRAPGAKRVGLLDFKDLNYVLMDEENDTYQRAVTMCSNAGFAPKTMFTKPAQMLTAYQLAQRSHAATFVSDTLVQYTDIQTPVYTYLLDDPVAFRQQYLYYRRSQEQPAAVRLFLDFMQDQTHPHI